MLTMKAPCQAVVWYLLPAIGAELARELGRRKMPQKEIAKRLGITPAAISQYLKGSRGAEVKLGTRSLAEVKKLAREVEAGKAGETEMIRTVCGICRIAWAERTLCGHHMKMHTCATCPDGKMRCKC